MEGDAYNSVGISCWLETPKRVNILWGNSLLSNYDSWRIGVCYLLPADVDIHWQNWVRFMVLHL